MEISASDDLLMPLALVPRSAVPNLRNLKVPLEVKI